MSNERNILAMLYADTNSANWLKDAYQAEAISSDIAAKLLEATEEEDYDYSIEDVIIASKAYPLGFNLDSAKYAIRYDTDQLAHSELRTYICSISLRWHIVRSDGTDIQRSDKYPQIIRWSERRQISRTDLEEEANTLRQDNFNPKLVVELQLETVRLHYFDLMKRIRMLPYSQVFGISSVIADSKMVLAPGFNALSGPTHSRKGYTWSTSVVGTAEEPSLVHQHFDHFTKLTLGEPGSEASMEYAMQLLNDTKVKDGERTLIILDNAMGFLLGSDSSTAAVSGGLSGNAYSDIALLGTFAAMKGIYILGTVNLSWLGSGRKEGEETMKDRLEASSTVTMSLVNGVNSFTIRNLRYEKVPTRSGTFSFALTDRRLKGSNRVVASSRGLSRY